MEMSSIIVRSSQYRHISDTGLCVIPNLGWMVERDNCPGTILGNNLISLGSYMILWRNSMRISYITL